MDEVENDYIEKALTELMQFFGTREFIDHEKLIALIRSKKVKEAIKDIASYLGLPIEVNISYVPKGYRPSASDGFSSTHLVKTDWRGRGTSGITAQVSIPSNLPFYGTSGMTNFPINVRLSENCAENPATLISVMAHELSHILALEKPPNSVLVAGAGLEPASLAAQDFKSCAYTNSATRARHVSTTFFILSRN